jgi:hypothetical protein
MQVEDLGIGDHQSFQELVNYPDHRSHRMTQMLKCKEEDALDSNSRDSDDVSQYFKTSEDQGFPTKRRKTSVVRREINYQDDDGEILEKEISNEYSIADGQSLDDGSNAGNRPSPINRSKHRPPFEISPHKAKLSCWLRGMAGGQRFPPKSALTGSRPPSSQ